jgi:hypothetical protein
MHQSLFLHTLFSLTFLAVSWGCTSHTQYRSEAVEPPDYKAVESDKADIVRGENGYLLGLWSLMIKGPSGIVSRRWAHHCRGHPNR